MGGTGVPFSASRTSLTIQKHPPRKRDGTGFGIIPAPSGFPFRIAAYENENFPNIRSERRSSFLEGNKTPKETWRQIMRRIILTIVAGAVMALAGLSAASASPAAGWHAGNPAVREAGLQQVQYGGYCARLRWACRNKYELGEAGMGNCRRYREECGRDNYCERLRRACEYKYERGEAGQGNCRRYREECGRY